MRHDRVPYTQGKLRAYRIKAKHALGQNFLVDEDIYRRIVASANLTKTTCVVEVGAGFGSLTRHLAQASLQVVAVEYDENLFGLLKKEMAGLANVSVLHADILKISTEKLLSAFPKPATEYSVVANLPYQITAKALEHFLTAAHPPTQLVLMLQREVVERITATPGNMSMLALVTQWHADVTKLFDVPASAFKPQPKVASAVARLIYRKVPPATVPDTIDEDYVFRVAKIGFLHKRKMLVSTLSAAIRVQRSDVQAIFEKIGISLTARPQELSFSQWIALAAHCKKAS